MSSDDDAPVARKAVKKPAKAADSDDDEVTVRRPGAAAAGGARPKPAKPASDSDSDHDAAAPRLVRVAGGAAYADPAAAGGSADDAAEEEEHKGVVHCPEYDYDTMTEEAFSALLKQFSRPQRAKQIADRNAADKAAEEVAERGAGAAEERQLDRTPGYKYDWMLGRVLDICRASNPDAGNADRIKLPMPKIERGGAKKTAFTNFAEVCKALGRSMEEVKDFVEKHLTTQSSIDSNNVLMIRIVNAKTSAFERLLHNYVEQFCRCNACGKINTELTRDPSSRLQLLICRNCQATRYIHAAGAATYQAQTTRRARIRAKNL